MNMEEQLQATVDKAAVASTKWHAIINGDINATIETEGGIIPTVAKQINDTKNKIMTGVNETIDNVEVSINKIHLVVNGDENTVISTENGEISSLAKTLKEIKADLTLGVDEIVGTALSAKEIIQAAQIDITEKHELIKVIKTDIDAKSENITTINQTFETSVNAFETTVATAISSVNTTKDTAVDVLREEKAGLSTALVSEKNLLITNLQSETTTQIQNIETEGDTQKLRAEVEANRATQEANRVSQPLVQRTETSGDIAIDWSQNQDYYFSLSANSNFTFANLPTNDNQSNFKQFVISATAIVTPSFPSNVVFAEDNAPVFALGKTYQLIFQFIAANNKILAGFVEY